MHQLPPPRDNSWSLKVEEFETKFRSKIRTFEFCFSSGWFLVGLLLIYREFGNSTENFKNGHHSCVVSCGSEVYVGE